MKLFGIALIVVCLAGCSGGGAGSSNSTSQTIGDPMTPSSKSSDSDTKTAKKSTDDGAPKQPKQFEDSVFKVPIYPGATEVNYTRLTMNTDASKSYNCTFQTSDSADKVADFYTTEGAKIGKVEHLPIGDKPGTGFRTVAVEVNAKERLQIQAMTNPKDKTTAFSMHYIISAK